ncbi:MAG: hypothetical protein IKP65_09100 [Alphaproteobacteria bacterium]|nr:hypothetical protein [Alphaproteobacteria bacterium]
MKFNEIVKNLKSGKNMKQVELAIRIEVEDNMWLPQECYDAFYYEDDTEDIRQNIWETLKDDCMCYLKREINKQNIKNENDLYHFIRLGLSKAACNYMEYINR